MPRIDEVARFLFVQGGDASPWMREDRSMSPGQATPDPLRIVIADDDPLFARMIRAHLSARPEFDVVALAADGGEAVRLTEELEPDLVLLDVSMPVLDGIAAAQAIQDAGSPPAIVLITGEDEASDARAYRAGASAYLRKSGDVVGLMDVILAVSQLGVRRAKCGAGGARHA